MKMNSFIALMNKLKITTFDEAIDAIDAATKESNESRIVAFANSHAFNLSTTNKEFQKHLLASDFLFRDGIGVKILLKLFDIRTGDNLNGTDLIPKILERQGEGKSLVILGTTLNIVEKARPKFEALGLKIVYEANGFQSDKFYEEVALQYNADFYLLAMGMPKQEKIAALIKQRTTNTTIICGGAIVDFFGGAAVRAPLFMRKLGLEWLFRFINEPKRLFRRYVFGNVSFLCRAMYARLTSK